MSHIETFISKDIAERHTIEIPEFKPTGEVDMYSIKLNIKFRRRTKKSKIFNFFWDWYKSKGD